MTLAIDRFTV